MDQDQSLAVLPDVVLFGKLSPIPVAKQFIISDDLKDWADQMGIESTASSPVFGAANGSAWKNVNGYQRFSGWVASNLVPGATFKIKMALLSSLFQLLSGCIGLKSVLRDAKSLNSAIGNEVFLITLKIARSSNMASVSFFSLSIALCNISLGTSSNDIKSALGMFSVVTLVKLKLAGLWQYAVFVLVRKNSIRILPITNQNDIISSKDAFKAKLVNLFFGCIVFEISNLVFQCQDLNYLAVNCKKSSSFLPKLFFNTSGGFKVFKSSFAGSKFYAKAAALMVPSVAAATDIDLNLDGPPKNTTSMLPAVFSAPNFAVESRLTFLKFHFSKLSVLIKSLVELVGALVVLVTKLLSILSAVDVSVKESMAELAKQNKDLAVVASLIQKKITHFKKKCKQACLEDVFDDNNMVNNNNNNDKDFSVYNNTFNVMMHLWENQPSGIKSSPNQTAKWISSMVKNSHELISIMGKIYELDMFNILDSKSSTSM
ncbi:hypothetical protein G9A89_001163 [Geosiphon pyriformis]|nr:hypothetical protein G9A89_001163 [Geosiphon pyriformis]